MKIPLVERVIQRQHRLAMANFAKSGFKWGTDALRWRIGLDQIGKERLNCRVPLPKCIVFSIGDVRSVLLIVGPIVPRNLPRQPFQLRRRLLVRQPRNVHAHALTPSNSSAAARAEIGDTRASQHARNFFAPSAALQRLHSRGRGAPNGPLHHAKMRRAARGNLRTVSHHKYLQPLRHACQALTHRRRGGAADARNPPRRRSGRAPAKRAQALP